MSDEQANPETGAASDDAAISYLLRPEAPEQEKEAPQEEREDKAEVEPEPDNSEGAEGEEPEAAANDAEPEEVEEEPKYRVKVNGVEVEVTLPELLSGYQREADYRKKTAATAEERRALEAEKAAIEERKQQLENARLQALAAQGFEPEPDWEKLFADDPIGAMEQRVKWESAQKRRAQAQQELQQRHEAAKREIAQRERAALLEKVPEWQDPKAFDEAAAKMTEAASAHYGIAPNEIAENLDHRLFLMLKDAMAYRALQEAKPVVEKRVSTAPKVQKPGAPATRADERRKSQEAIRNRLRENPSDTDAAVQYLLRG